MDGWGKGDGKGKGKWVRVIYEARCMSAWYMIRALAGWISSVNQLHSAFDIDLGIIL